MEDRAERQGNCTDGREDHLVTEALSSVFACGSPAASDQSKSTKADVWKEIDWLKDMAFADKALLKWNHQG